MNKNSFPVELSNHNITLDDNQIKKFDSFYHFLIEENNKYNLTAITNEDEVYEKHFFDSLSLFFSEKLNGTLLDVGAGAGFPSIPLAISNPNLSVSVIDSTLKRINFVKEFSNKENLNISTFCARAEEFNQKFDYVTARGVAQLNVLLELCCNLVKENGILIAMKGSSYEEELKNAENAIKKLGYELIKKQEYTLPTEKSNRCNLFFKKMSQHSNKYPRNYSQIKKKPL